MQVCSITEHQAQGEKESNWHNSTKVDATRHGHLFPRIEDVCEAGKTLRHNRRKDEMPCCQEDCYSVLEGRFRA